ncbi:MAG TPA: tRNA 2-thiouridine(34) synthase MnmA [Rubricoccaceae bacterium]|jgi:tRNA-specific 2-thiouridylase
MSRHGRVLVAMSGGVDSSVAAVLLHEQGYEVVGATMKTWDYETSLGGSEVRRDGTGGAKRVSGCCSLDDMNDARAVAVGLGATHLVVDLRDEFGTAVTDRFVSDYLAGRTPNPCVLCNTHVKWGALARRADALGCEHIATGHYARTGTRVSPDGALRHTVSRGLDRGKDQSYVLWGVSQAHLARTLLPLGGLQKTEIRALAAEAALSVAAKKDSYEICFVPDDDYRGYLRRRVPGLDAQVDGGPFVHALTGETVGRHRGAPFYTVGQRRGLGLALGEPAYVIAIDVATNTVTVGPRSALGARALAADGVVWGAAGRFADETPVLAQVRAHGPAEPALARQSAPDTLDVVFASPRSAVAPGQAVVLYDGADGGETVLAGGWIATTEAAHHAESLPDSDFVALPTL